MEVVLDNLGFGDFHKRKVYFEVAVILVCRIPNFLFILGVDLERADNLPLANKHGVAVGSIGGEVLGQHD